MNRFILDTDTINDDIVVTRNVADFRRIPGVRVANWAD